MAKHIHKSASDPLAPSDTPFSYNVGVNYESWEVGRVGYSITNDLDQIHENFRLIRTYHDAAVGTSDPTVPSIDATQGQVIDWVVRHPGTELVMGTNNNALAQGGYGTPWSAGLMATRSYTDQWVAMIIQEFGGVDKVKIGLKAILLGNELDANGPPPSSSSFTDYVDTWIPAAFDNLKASLAAAGLKSIPITTTIANYGASNVVSVKVPAYISSNWGSAWNNGEPFVMFNQYTQNSGQSTDFAQVEQYFEAVEAALGTKLEVFVGETGYSTDFGADNQATVYQQIFDWLSGQRQAGGKTVPLFAFDAFDRPLATPTPEIKYGIYDEDSNSQPTGLKTKLKTIIPDWTTKQISAPSPHSEALYSSGAGETIKARGGDDIVLGRGGDDRLFGESGYDLLVGNSGHDFLSGGRGRDFLDGRLGDDTLDGGRGDDSLRGGRGSDVFVLAWDAGTDTVIGFRDGKDKFGLANDLRFHDLHFTQAGEDTEIHAGSELVAIVDKTNVSLLTRDDFLLI